METPTERIKFWERQIKKEEKINILEVIKIDLEQEKDDAESIVSDEDLIRMVEDKIDDAS